jgi:ABC-2 type transport system permease protein
MRREGSAFNGLGVVMLKELADHLTSIRFIILELIVMVIAVCTV